MTDKEKWPVKVPDYELSGKTAVITGGTKGIGYAISMLFGYFGAKVVIASRHQEECDAVAEEICGLGGQAIGVKADVCRQEDVEHLFAKAKEAYGSVDIAVNCAGISETLPILEMNEAGYDRVMNTNLKSVFFASREAAKYMKEQGKGGRIIQIASIGGLKGTKNISTYSASKAAVLNLTKTMALEWARYGITVNSICPGYVKTAINEEVFRNEKFLEQTLRSIPQRRLGTADEVAAIAAFLASDYSGMITGTYITADMGTTCG